jgi:MFS family permease
VNAARRPRQLAALIAAQVCLHSAMAGVRMAAPLWLLREGHTAAAVGLVLALFGVAPVLLALRAGRLVDRHGYHAALRWSVGLACAGALAALLAASLGPTPAWLAVATLCLAAACLGGGANAGLIAIQREAGRLASDTTDLKRVFSWLGLAPALANMVGPLLAGVLIDLAGFAIAFAALSVLPLVALSVGRLTERSLTAGKSASLRTSTAWELLREPGFTRLLAFNWVLSTCWDAHNFALPVLAHARGLSASALGGIFGIFAAAVVVVRLVIPWLAHRLKEAAVLSGAMAVTAVLFAVYPLLQDAWAMALVACALGASLGSVQPMIMSTLHQITPPERHGQAIALRSMTINASSAVMPLVFGTLGGALGVGALFWLVGAVVGAGSWAARKPWAP